MPREKFSIGEEVEVYCQHVVNGEVKTGWLAGKVVAADYRMAAIQFEAEVFSSNGWPIPERTLWCAHGSRNLRRPANKRIES